MEIHYISPSHFPSRTANSIHVLRQCLALSQLGHNVSLYGRRTVKNKYVLKQELENAYGFSIEDVRIRSYYSKISRADNLLIAIFAFWRCLFSKNGVVISRNLYASFMLTVLFRIPTIFETHLVESGFRKLLQLKVLGNSRTKTILISEKLLKILRDENGMNITDYLVLHDAAPKGITTIPEDQKKSRLEKIANVKASNWEFVCGYFGQLYNGRGIDIIEKVAEKLPDVLFLIAGGNEYDLKKKKAENKLPNLKFIGHVSNNKALKMMNCFDALMMPYQRKVSLGNSKFDTARWMSPMKMFEYLASGAAIISSDLPVLREVLVNENNSLLVSPDKPDEWKVAILRLIEDRELTKKLGKRAHQDYLTKYTWEKRGQEIINLATCNE